MSIFDALIFDSAVFETDAGGAPTHTYDPANAGGATLSNGNLSADNTGFAAIISQPGKATTGKWYLEWRKDREVINVFSGITTGDALADLGSSPGINDWAVAVNNDGQIFSNGVFSTGWRADDGFWNFNIGDWIGFAVDLDNDRFWYTRNGTTWYGSTKTGNPASNTGGFDISTLQERLFYRFVTWLGNGGATVNFGATAFNFTPPSGFLAWQSAGGGSGTDNLTASDLVVGQPVLGAPLLGQRHALAAQAFATGQPALGAPLLSQGHSLAAQAFATGQPVLGAPLLAQRHALSVAAFNTGQVVLGAPLLGQRHALVALGLTTPAPVLGTPILGSAGTNGLLVGDFILGQPVFGIPALSQRHVLAAQALVTGAVSLGVPAIAQRHVLATLGLATGAPALGTPLLAVIHALQAENLVTGPVLFDLFDLRQRHLLSVLALVAGQVRLGTPDMVVLPTGFAYPSIRWGQRSDSQILRDTGAGRSFALPGTSSSKPIPGAARSVILKD